MAVPRKQRRVEQHDNDSSDSSPDESNQEMEIVEVDFDVKFPESTDRHGIKNLLQQLFLKAHINTTELADLLIEQHNITSVVKEAAESDDMESDEESDVNFGVFSIVDLTAKKNLHCVQQIVTYLQNHCKEVCSKTEYEEFQKILDDSTKHVGLIISERFINIPAKIAVPLFDNLSNDIKKEGYDFSYYIMICKILNFPTASNQQHIVYLNPEEELISEEADFAFEFQVQTEQDSGLGGKWTDDDDEGIPKRKILLLPSSKLDFVCNKLTTELGPSAQQPLG